MSTFTRASGLRWLARIWITWLVISIGPIALPWIAVFVSGALLNVAILATIVLLILIGLAPPSSSAGGWLPPPPPGARAMDDGTSQHAGMTLGELMKRGDVPRPGAKPPGDS
jgi:hypothetical protein